MSNEPTKPAAGLNDNADMKKAGSTEKAASDAVKQESEQEEPAAEGAAAQLSDFA